MQQQTNGNIAVGMTGAASVHSSSIALHERPASQHNRQHTSAYRVTVSDIGSASAWFAERSTALWVCGNDSRSDFLELKMLEKSSLGDLRECSRLQLRACPMAVNLSQVDAGYSSSEPRSRPGAPFLSWLWTCDTSIAISWKTRSWSQHGPTARILK
jgi:hypothetical protein